MRRVVKRVPLRVSLGHLIITHSSFFSHIKWALRAAHKCEKHSLALATERMPICVLEYARLKLASLSCLMLCQQSMPVQIGSRVEAVLAKTRDQSGMLDHQSAPGNLNSAIFSLL